MPREISCTNIWGTLNQFIQSNGRLITVHASLLRVQTKQFRFGMLIMEQPFISCKVIPILFGPQAGHQMESMPFQQALMEQQLSGMPPLELKSSHTQAIAQPFARYHGHQMDSPSPLGART